MDTVACARRVTPQAYGRGLTWVFCARWAQTHLRIRCPSISNDWKIAFILLVGIGGLERRVCRIIGCGSFRRVLQLRVLHAAVIDGHRQDGSRGGKLIHGALVGVGGP